MLTDEQQKEVMENLERNGVSASCPACGHSERIVNENPVFLPGGTNPGAPTFPAVIVQCRNCGHTSFFYAENVGINLDTLKD